MECRCANVIELYGPEAGDYVTEHLRPDGDGYVCPDTGRRWRVDDDDDEQTRIVQI